MTPSFIRAALTEFLSSDYRKLPWIKLKLRILLSKLTSSVLARTSDNYLRMQRRQYEAAAAVARVEPGKLRGDCVAVADWEMQNDFPDYKKLLFGRIRSAQNFNVLEYGCGPGRNLMNWWQDFQQIDGVDIAQRNLDNANILLKGVIPPTQFPRLFLTSGANCGAAPLSHYDVCFSILCLQHISVWSIRDSILRSLYEALKPGGLLAFQMVAKPRPGMGAQTVKYRDEHVSAGVTNGGCDVCIDDPSEVVRDLESLGFVNVEFKIIPVSERVAGVFEEHLIFTALKRSM